MITKEQEAMLHELLCNTHTLWNEDGAKAFTKPFGFECRVFKHKADYNDPKGLQLDDGAKFAVGASSWEISGQIASHYGLRPEGKLGRGSQVRSDCEAIRKHLNGEA